MRLIRSADLRARLGLGQVDTFVVAADIACDEATTHVETDLRTPLLQSYYVDYFLTQPGDQWLNKITLKLTAGFVDAASFHIGTGYTRDDAAADTSMEADALLNAEKGTVVLTDSLCSVNRWITVRYTAGFPAAAAPNTDELIDLTDAPEWLGQIAEMKALSLIANSPELENKEGKIVDGTAFSRAYSAAIESHIRYVPGARLPTA